MAKVQLIVCIMLYWAMLFLLFSTTLDSPFAGSYNVSDISGNFTGSDPSTEIDSGGFLGGIFGEVVGIFTIGARFFALIALGIGLPAGIPTWLQLFVSVINVIIFSGAIGIIISMFWNG